MSTFQVPTGVDPDAAFRLCVQFSQFTAKLNDGSCVDVPRKYDEWVVDYRFYTLEMLQKDLAARVQWGSGQQPLISEFDMSTDGEKKLLDNRDLTLAFAKRAGRPASSPSKRQKTSSQLQVPVQQLEGASAINTSPGPVTRSQTNLMELEGVNQITSSPRPVTRSQTIEGARNIVTTPTKSPAKRLPVKKKLTPRKGKNSVV